MKTTYTLFILLLSVSFFGQTTINTTKTPQHQEIRGSKISMIAPKAFVVGTNFMGFQQAETNSSIMVVEIPGAFAEISKGLTKENLQKQGVQVERIESSTINQFPGLFITAEQTTKEVLFRKYFLVFGTDKETIVITGMVPKGSAEIENLIKNALMTTFYDADKVLTPLNALDFEIATEGTDFVFAKAMTNMLVYNRDGKFPSETDDKASLVVAKGFSREAITDKKEFATNRINMLPVQITKINAVVPIEISGLSGFEITAEGVDRKTGMKEQAYQVMLFEGNSYYILFGSSEANFESNLTVFQKLVRTFKLK